MNIEQIAALYIAEKRNTRRANTCDGYESALRRHVLPRWGSLRIDEVEPAAIQDWVDGFAGRGRREGVQDAQAGDTLGDPKAGRKGVGSHHGGGRASQDAKGAQGRSTRRRRRRSFAACGGARTRRPPSWPCRAAFAGRGQGPQVGRRRLEVGRGQDRAHVRVRRGANGMSTTRRRSGRAARSCCPSSRSRDCDPCAAASPIASWPRATSRSWEGRSSRGARSAACRGCRCKTSGTRGPPWPLRRGSESRRWRFCSATPRSGRPTSITSGRASRSRGGAEGRAGARIGCGLGIPYPGGEDGEGREGKRHHTRRLDHGALSWPVDVSRVVAVIPTYTCHSISDRIVVSDWDASNITIRAGASQTVDFRSFVLYV